MHETCIPIEWYYPSAASGPVPCAWKVWMEGSASSGGQWMTIYLFDVD